MHNNSDYENVKGRLSLSNLTEREIAGFAAEIAPQVRDKKIRNTAQVEKAFPKLTGGQAARVMDEARRMIRKDAARQRERKFRDWKAENYPLIAQVDEAFPRGIKPDKKFGDAKTLFSSYFNFKDGQDSDEAAQILDVDEQKLIDTLNGLDKQKFKDEYNAVFSQRAKQGELLQLRKDEIEDIQNQIVYEGLPVNRELVRQYPEIAEFVENLILTDGDYNFGDIDSASANVAGVNDSGESSARKMEKYRVLREIAYRKESGDV